APLHVSGHGRAWPSHPPINGFSSGDQVFFAKRRATELVDMIIQGAKQYPELTRHVANERSGTGIARHSRNGAESIRCIALTGAWDVARREPGRSEPHP